MQPEPGAIIEEHSYHILEVGKHPPEFLESALKDKIQITGMDSKTPYFRICNQLFKGTYDKTIGTDLIFAVGMNEIMSFVGKNDNRIMLEKINVEPKI